jgi:stringent starvation protein B
MASNLEKMNVINKYLEDDYILLHLDARKEGVDIPDHLMGNPTVTLKISYGFKGGMQVTEERVWAALTFGGRFRDCFIPMAAIWGATTASGANTIWPEDAPPEIVAQIIEELKPKQDSSKPTPALTAAFSAPTEAKMGPKPTKAARPKRMGPKPSHLKRVK